MIGSSDLDEKAAHYEYRLEITREKNAKLTEEARRLKKDFDTTQSQRDKEHEQTRHLQDTLQELEKIKTKLETDLQNTNQKLSQLRSKITTLQQRPELHEFQTLDLELSKTKSELVIAKSKIASLQLTFERQLAQLKVEIANLRNGSPKMPPAPTLPAPNLENPTEQITAYYSWV